MQSVIHLGVLALSLCASTSLCSYWLRKKRIAQFARGVTRDCRSQRAAAFALGRVIFADVRRNPQDPVFIAPMLSALGASPVAVLRKGGCCSGTHRVFITSLDSIGIRASQITVFRKSDPAAAHCLAQVTADAENLLIDVDYGVWYRNPRGGMIDLLTLRSGVEPIIEPFALGEGKYANSARARATGYPDSEYYRFDYAVTRTANWAQTIWKSALYAVLHRLTQGRIDCMLLPPVFEWPEILLAIAFCFLGLLLLSAGSIAAII
jgi:hypothetical protein